MPDTPITFMLDRFKAAGDTPALAWRDQVSSYAGLGAEIADAIALLQRIGIGPQARVVLLSDFSPRSVAFLLAIVQVGATIVPLLPATRARIGNLAPVVSPTHEIEILPDGAISWRLLEAPPPSPLFEKLGGNPGLVLFTSGSTGEPKAVLHDFGRLLRKFHVARPTYRTLNLLLFDHWGGINTLLHSLSNLGFIVLPEGRRPAEICDLVERHRLELLPASPTFLNMLLISGAHAGRDLGALKLITYGAEPMPDATLKGLRRAFPEVELRQTYGLIELGVLRAKSRSSDSLWLKVGGEGYDVRVVDGMLQIKAASAMLGYLNAPSPFTDDGYFMTGDRVEVDGEYLRILGRASDLINVGGQKVFPAEVESVLLSSDLVEDAVVYGERSPLVGSIVCCDVKLRQPLDEGEARVRIRQFCAQRLQPFMVPVRIRIVEGGIHGERMKRLRRPAVSPT
jgi:acyl-coenzyme A synthetase/AMP-(fatty) acid ligase